MNFSFIKEIKTETVCRVGAAMSLLFSSGFTYSPEQLLSTYKGLKLEVSSGCSWEKPGYGPYLNVIFRDDPKQRRAVVFGVSNGETESFNRYSTNSSGPTESVFSMVGSTRDLQGNGFLLEPGVSVTVSLYPAVQNAVADDVYRIGQLRTQTESFASRTIQLRSCEDKAA